MEDDEEHADLAFVLTFGIAFNGPDLPVALRAVLDVEIVETGLALSFIRSSVANLKGAATVVGRFLAAGMPLMQPLSRIFRLSGLALKAYFFISSTTKSSVDFMADFEQERARRELRS